MNGVKRLTGPKCILNKSTGIFFYSVLEIYATTESSFISTYIPMTQKCRYILYLGFARKISYVKINENSIHFRKNVREHFYEN